jgi:formylglycine-generating enzyme required for sulfatase activity
MEFVLVPKGKSWLGGGGGKPGNKVVEVLHDFYLGTYEVTQEEWHRVTGENPSWFARSGVGMAMVDDIPDADLKRFPVELISWEGAQAFVALLNQRCPEPGWLYRLPTEAEWEYACRGGPLANQPDAAFHYYFDKPANELLPGQANFGDGLKRPRKVGSYKPNLLGLYDMHGNVWEWCEEFFAGKGPAHATRGGCWANPASSCRASNRIPGEAANGQGLRIAKVPAGETLVKLDPVPAAEARAPGPSAVAAKYTNSLGMQFALVPKGKAWLGGGGGQPGTTAVEFKDDFYLGVYEVTQDEWAQLMAGNPSHFSRTGAGKDAVKGVSDADLKRFPVDNISWQQAQQFIAKLNERAPQPGWVYRLPTENEWEYACRGGPQASPADSVFHAHLAVPAQLLSPAQANFKHAQGLSRTAKVGSYPPNRLGLHDMHGNVWELCYEDLGEKNGIQWRAMRGGAWNHDAEFCRAARSFLTGAPIQAPGHGLRVARVPAGVFNDR